MQEVSYAYVVGLPGGSAVMALSDTLRGALVSGVWSAAFDPAALAGVR